MQFSVVVPLYNKAPHVEGTIRSVLAQSHAPLEIVVVDDGSTDGGLDIVRAIDDPRIRIFERSPPGPGGYAARNLAIQEARGEWIAFIDADDDWTEDHLAGFARAVAGCEAPVGGVLSRLATVSAGASEDYAVSDRHLVSGRAHPLADMLRAWLEKQRCPVWTGAVAFRRDLLIDAGLFPAGKARRGGDKDLWLRCMARAPMAYHPHVTAHFHQDTVNRVSNTAAHATLPIIVQTIAAMLPSASPLEKGLLRRLSNQEVGLYASYATGAGAKLDRSFLSAIYFPEGILTAIRVLAMMAILPLFARKRR